MADSNDRKTLTLKPASRPPAKDDGPRQRSGARAWKVARQKADEPEEHNRTDNAAPAPRRDDHQRGRKPHGERPRPSRPEFASPRREDGRPPRDGEPRQSRSEFSSSRRDEDRRQSRTDRPRPARDEFASARRPGGPEARRDRRGPAPDRDTPPRAAMADDASLPQRRPRGERHTARQAETYAAFASCPQGMEGVLAAELTELGFDEVAAGRSGVHFRTDWLGMMRANLHSRLATRILLQVAQAPVANEDELLELARQTPWERWFGAEQRLRVDTSAIRSPAQSLQYCTLRTKDGICDRLRELEGERPSIDTVRPDARVHVFLNENWATLYLDTSGESLFKRGWRLDKGEAPLRENLAAGMLALSGWPGDVALLDPFCGSGTILIEAAYQALRVPPGIKRPFAFERLRHHDDVLWRQLKEDARSRILPQLTMPLLGSDASAHAITTARANAARAGLTEDAILFEVRDARDIRPPEGDAGWIVSNPPYGGRMTLQEREGAAEAEEPDDATIALWQDFSHTLKGHFDGWQTHIITTDRDLPKHLRLAARRRTPLYNGALDCRLFAFDVVGGTYRQRL
ncbi:MAG: THUMP domain-containing protein [Pigmentiphaga sp.]